MGERATEMSIKRIIIILMCCLVVSTMLISCSNENKNGSDNYQKVYTTYDELIGFEDPIPESGYERYGYINREGDFFIEPQFRHAEDFSEGLAEIGIGYIDMSGNLVIECQFHYPGPFSEGLAVAKKEDS